MRLLIVSEGQDLGGVQTMLKTLTRALTAAGESVQTLSAHGPARDWTQRWPQEARADVIAAANAYRSAYLAALLGWVLRKPVVIWVHGPVREVMAQARTGWIRRALMGWSYGRAQALVCVSEASKSSLLSAFPALPQARCRVIRNPAPSRDEGDPEVQVPRADLGFVGRLSPEKRPELLLDLMVQLPDHYRLNLIGDGPMRPPLEASARALGLYSGDHQRDRVRFLGEMVVTPAVYRTWKATVVCSAYEGFPLVALESLAAGVPCVGVPIPALQELLSDCAPDWVAQDASPQSLAHTALGVLRQDAEALHAMASSIAQRHGEDAFCAQWRALLRQLSPVDRDPSLRRMTVHCVHTGQAYMPEIEAYGRHVEALGHQWAVHRSAATVPDDADVVWWMCGVVNRLHSVRLRRSLHVHEYASASVGAWPSAKDWFKRWWNPAPHYRVFQSDAVRTLMGFSDAGCHCLRDMGVPESFVVPKDRVRPRFDLVYVGETGRLLQFQDALMAIGQAGLSVLLVGSVSDALANRLQRMPWVHSIGAVAHSEVPQWMVQARAGLNLTPVRRPLHLQTSTKVLEYLALGLPVVSNRYPWMESLAASKARSRIHWVHDVSSGPAWVDALSGLDGLDVAPPGVPIRTWPEVLRALPIWAELGLVPQRARC